MSYDYITRKDALLRDLKSYFMGVPCGRGHVAPRRTDDGYCRQCQREPPSRLRRQARRAEK